MIHFLGQDVKSQKAQCRQEENSLVFRMGMSWRMEGRIMGGVIWK